MKTIFYYPPSLEKHQVRLGAFLVFIFSSLVILLNNFHNYFDIILTLILWLDFFICCAISPKYSLLKPIISLIFNKFINKEYWISSKPKRFAKFCGFFILSLAIIIYYFNPYYFLIPISMLSLFSFLEAAFDFCVACKLYGIAQKIGFIPQDSCENC